MLKQYSENEILGKPLTEQQKKELLALMEMRDEDIDLSDIPEIREIPPDAVRGKFYRGRTIRLSEEVHAYLCEVAARKGASLNDLVNEVLSKELAIVETIK